MIYEFNGYKPVIHPTSFVHKEATIIGNVIIGKNVYIGPGASLRGDWGQITIEDGCNVQDNCIIHIFPGKDVVLQEGKYGLYVSWNKINRSVSLQDLNKTREEVILEDVVTESKNVFERATASKPNVPERNLGIYQSKTSKVAKKDASVIVRDGKYGLYVRWNKRNVSVSKIGKDITDIKLSDVSPFLDGKVIFR